MGKLMIFPTDTVYGIGCSIYDHENQQIIYKIKKRPLDKPLAVLCADLRQIEEITIVDEKAKTLIKAFLPGPLTLILPVRKELQDKIGMRTMGVRIPNCDIALEILREMGPMTTTSVNDSGTPPLNEYEEINLLYKTEVDYIYPPTKKSANLPSTIIEIFPSIKIIRQGAITLEMINKILKV